MAATASATPTSTIPYFGRAWSISVQTQAGGTFQITNTVAAGEEPLRATFRIDTYMLTAFWIAEVKVYNMTASTAAGVTGTSSSGQPQNMTLWQFNEALNAGDLVTISAGYQTTGQGQAFSSLGNQLFQGHLFQAAWTRTDVTDYVLTMRCIIGLMEDTLNFTSNNIPKNRNSLDVINQVALDAGITIAGINTGASTALSNQRFPRSQVFHDKPLKIIQDTCKQVGVFPWLDSKGLQLRRFDPSDTSGDNPLNAKPAFAYAPVNLTVPSTFTTTIKPTLLGVPNQIQKGVVFRVMMDNTVQIGTVLQLAPGTFINFYAVTPGPGQNYPPAPNPSGIYICAGVRHVGDTRGPDWYSEITSFTSNFFAQWLQGTQPTTGQVSK